MTLYTESLRLPIIKQRQSTWNLTTIKWQRIVSVFHGIQSRIQNWKNKLNAERVCGSTEQKALWPFRTNYDQGSQSFQKDLHCTQINVKEIVTCTRRGFSDPSFSINLSKKQVYKLNCFCYCFNIDDHKKTYLHVMVRSFGSNPL